jgi:hypothetical protein
MRMMAVDVRTKPAPRFGRARPLFDFAPAELGFSCLPARCWAVSPDGGQFYVTRWTPPAVAPAPLSTVDLVLNWTEELKARVPAGPAR